MAWPIVNEMSADFTGVAGLLLELEHLYNKSRFDARRKEVVDQMERAG